MADATALSAGDPGPPAPVTGRQGGAPVLLVIRPTGLGDLLMGIPALRALRRAFVNHEFVTTCPSALVPLASRVGVVDRFVTELDAGAAPLDPSLHRRIDVDILSATFAEPVAPDVVVVLKMPENEINRRVLARHPRVHLAFAHPAVAETAGFPVYDGDVHVLTRWEQLLAPSGIIPDPAELTLDVGVPPLPPAAGYTVIHPGSGSPTRRWPLDRWAAVARALAARGQRVVLTGSPAERGAVLEIVDRAALGPEADASRTTGILDLARLVAGAGLVLGVDSGVPHLATVLRRRAVTLFGPTPPTVWGPPPGDPLHRVLWRGRPGLPYGDEPDPGLLQITVDDVLAAATAPWPTAPRPTTPRPTAA